MPATSQCEGLGRDEVTGRYTRCRVAQMMPVAIHANTGIAQPVLWYCDEHGGREAMGNVFSHFHRFDADSGECGTCGLTAEELGIEAPRRGRSTTPPIEPSFSDPRTTAAFRAALDGINSSTTN